MIQNKKNTSEQETQKLDQSIFKKRENFNVEQDTIEKAKKYGVEILFDYKGEGKRIQ